MILLILYLSNLWLETPASEQEQPKIYPSLPGRPNPLTLAMATELEQTSYPRLGVERIKNGLTFSRESNLRFVGLY